MLNFLLRSRIKTCSAGAKFSLVRLVQIYGVGTPIAMSMKGLAKEIGVTNRVVSDAIQQLVAKGLLSLETTGGKPGRPSSSYMCDWESLLEVLTLRERSKPKSLFVDSINQILHGELNSELKQLHYANRLLLAVLLAHADEFGAVRGLGLRDLSELTGLKKEVLHQRLVTLQDQCLIRATVPGVTGSALFKPTKSLYILNLGHPTLHAQAGPYPVILGNPQNINRARSIFVAARVNKSSPLGLGHGFYAVDDLFNDANSARLVPMLQAKIDGYASFLLSEHTDVLPPDLPVNEELCERIRRDFAHLEARYVGANTESGAPGDLVLLFHAEAVTLARQIMVALKAATDLCGKVFKCMLLPPPRRPSPGLPLYWALLVIPAAGTSLRETQVKEGRASLSLSYEQEEKIPLEYRYRYGLLTRPRGASKNSN